MAKFWPWSQLSRIEASVNDTLRRVKKMAITQEQFDTDLSSLVTEIDTLITAVEALRNSKADLTAEDQAVLDAAAKVQAELSAIGSSTTP